MSQLFLQKSDFQIARLSGTDAQNDTDHLKKLRELVLENEPMYPNIDKWFDNKVVPGLKSSERIGYIGYLDGQPTVSAIVKRGENAKFCHLKIKDELQNINLGEAFFALMGLEVKGFCQKIHFTIPEGLWTEKNGFFKSFGFTKVAKAGHQYRLFEDELWCSSSFNTVWATILEKLPKIARAFSMNGHSLGSRILMSIKSEYAKKIVSGTKRVEIRRQFSKKWSGSRVSIYASGIERSIVGEVSIKNVVIDKPNNIWEKFHNQIGCSKKEFDKYTESKSEIYAVELEDAIPYEKTVSLQEASSLAKKKLCPPQNYYDLGNNVKWAEAVSISALLQNTFRIKDPVLI